MAVLLQQASVSVSGLLACLRGSVDSIDCRSLASIAFWAQGTGQRQALVLGCVSQPPAHHTPQAARACWPQVVAADYAFVLHTAHPVTGASGQTFGEVVVGMGEALVGNYPGRCA